MSALGFGLLDALLERYPPTIRALIYSFLPRELQDACADEIIADCDRRAGYPPRRERPGGGDELAARRTFWEQAA